jgi:hypothetical protein
LAVASGGKWKIREWRIGERGKRKEERENSDEGKTLALSLSLRGRGEAEKRTG